MRKNIINFFVGLAVVLLVVFAVAVMIGWLGSGVGGDGGNGQPGVPSGVGHPLPDTVSVSPASGGDDEVVADKTHGYSFTMPSNWYLEGNAGAGITVYPDYDPDSGVAPECKIEIAALAAPDLAGGDGAASADAVGGTALGAWVTAHLHADPTADVLESSETNIKVGGAPAVEWQGSLNGVTTTLVYIATPKVGSMENVLEFAPSTLAEDDADDSASGDCDIALEALLANVQFEP